MGTTLTPYNSLLKYLMNGTVNLESDTIKMALVTSDYVFDAQHDVLADVLASPSPEVEEIASPSNGYTTGGKEITSKSVTLVDSPALATWDALDLTWTALTATFRYGIIYSEKSVGSPAVVNPLIGCVLFNDTPADISVAGIDFINQWNPNGILTQG